MRSPTRSKKQDWLGLQGELGDLLLQVVYHAQMAEEAGHFTFADVAKSISDKMVARHPHVFGDDSREKSARAASSGLGNGESRRTRRARARRRAG